MQYKDASLTLGGGKADEEFGSSCDTTSASLDGTAPKILEGGFAVESEPDVSVDPCGRRGSEPEVIFSPSAGLAFRSTGQQDGRSCNAVMKGGKAAELTDPIPFSKLRVGQKFCNTHPYDSQERVELLRVQDISAKGRKVTFTVTAWEQNE
ncbi:hypothetical protein ACQEU8_01350 [Streptomyces sp. CA-250714]|uniref:hypothetical protein n=1 Tax=Streptomyces sp. CA-250714 TaxID=3240060 RepID=UPI003D922AA2